MASIGKRHAKVFVGNPPMIPGQEEYDVAYITMCIQSALNYTDEAKRKELRLAHFRSGDAKDQPSAVSTWFMERLYAELIACNVMEITLWERGAITTSDFDAKHRVTFKHRPLEQWPEGEKTDVMLVEVKEEDRGFGASAAAVAFAAEYNELGNGADEHTHTHTHT